MKTRTLAISAMYCALAILFIAIPIKIGPITLAVLMLLPLLVAAQTESFLVALFLSLFVGVLSLSNAFLQPGPLTFMFQNPLISILPRIFIGPVVYFANKGLSALFSKRNSKTLDVARSTIASALGVLTNTSLVVLMIYLIYSKKEFTFNGVQTVANAKFFSVVISINFVVELVMLSIIVPAIVTILKKLPQKKENIEE